MKCPDCNEECFRDEVVIAGAPYGPWVCHECGWRQKAREKPSDRPIGHCTLCGLATEVVVNINLEKVRVCDRCCLAITKQTVAPLTVESLEGK